MKVLIEKVSERRKFERECVCVLLHLIIYTV